MHAISTEDIRMRIQRDNPWWSNPHFKIPEAGFRRRVYYKLFQSLATNLEIRRATILLGPRRVGKTVIIKQLISELIAGGQNSQSILYTSIDAPVFSGISLEKFIELMPALPPDESRYVIFDEIQYLKDWEIHLKDLVDSYPSIKFIATGSAAAALRLKSRESGAGRFSEFMLPPLTFYEFIQFIDEESQLIDISNDHRFVVRNINLLNNRFVDYLNFGGYPEAVLNLEIRNNSEQFIRNDIIDKVLLKDLPSLYGINEIQVLNKLFSFLAYNAGNEASLENISTVSGLTKPTIRKYIDYLESAFLIIKLSTVDENCRTMKRERNFKIYLNNPSMRAALFAPVDPEDSVSIGHLAESAVFSQWQHARSFRQLRYSRWRSGEVDIVYLDTADDKPFWIGEVKWSDRTADPTSDDLKGIKALLKKHDSIISGFVTTKTISRTFEIQGREIRLIPTALYCYTVGRNITSSLDKFYRVELSNVEEEVQRTR
jgi:hypothetical protein